METKYLEEIEKLEKEIEDRQISNENDIKSLQARSEESLA
jgi:hypothetical protein